MSCECTLTITSILTPYHRIQEGYPKMPCDAAIEFLNKLNSPQNTSKTEKLPEYRVLYNITNTEEKYSNTMAEPPEKAAATIKLFMRNPKWMPNKIQ